MMQQLERISAKLKILYGEERAGEIYRRLVSLLDISQPAKTIHQLALSEQDIMLITYGDQVQRAGERPLVTLGGTLKQLDVPLSCVHLLPFYPYSSDDGFSVMDYYQVDPALGDWDDITRLARQYRLMFDAVFNHISAKSAWFSAFLRGEAPYTNYFITLQPDEDVSLVTRPRTHPLLTPFETAGGIQYVWTTFSDDQIDLNVANPDVLLELIKALLFYVGQGAQFIRLDAIAFLWKQLGTSCIHLPQTHLVIQLLRDVLDIAAPETILITETNVPHEENLSYFGDGANEAQLVYQFALPPLILHTLATSDATRLTDWAKNIHRVSDRTTFFNFTASHDGIGLRPAQGILTDEEINALVERTKAHGGEVSFKSNGDGSQSPYELNITYFDAITAPEETASAPETSVSRFMISQAIMLAVVGMPGIYFHSLIGSRNYRQGVQETGRYRTINREKLDADALLKELNDTNSLRHRVFERYCRLLAVRVAEPAFHPLGDQIVHSLHPQVFAVERIALDGASGVLALHNVADQSVMVKIPQAGQYVNLIDQQPVEADSPVTLTPYQILWLKKR
jgi:sucrose phosphorylase